MADAPRKEPSPDLQQFASKEGLTDSDVQMLAGVNFRGQRPQNLDGWRLVWSAIKASVR